MKNQTLANSSLIRSEVYPHRSRIIVQFPFFIDLLFFCESISSASRVIMLPKGCAPTTSTTKCHYYEKPSTVPVASPLPLYKREKSGKERKRDE